jgi:hypothetical protein
MECFERNRGTVRRAQHRTPVKRKSGSHPLNVAECKLSCLKSQCLRDRRIGELPLLQSEIGIWAEKTNGKQRGVNWQFQSTTLGQN